MRKILDCRRSSIAVIAIACLTYLGASQGMDVAGAISIVAGAVAGSNMAQKIGEKKYEKKAESII